MYICNSISGGLMYVTLNVVVIHDTLRGLRYGYNIHTYIRT